MINQNCSDNLNIYIYIYNYYFKKMYKIDFRLN